MADKIVEIHHLSYTYPNGTRALDDVSLEVYDGESVGLVGRNGSGKSTLLLHLNGVMDHHSSRKGVVRIGGLDVEKKNLRPIRSLVGLVFQDPDDQLFMPTVFDDVAFGPINMGCSENEIRERVDRALAQVDMLDFKHRAPYHLSGGQKRSVSIATVLSMDPKILVLDEPTSSLDPRGRRLLINLLKNLNITKLIASHDLDMVVDICERCILLDGGQVIADGPTQVILSDEQLLLSHGLEKPLSLVER